MSETQIVIETIIQSLAEGLLIGALYGLMCVGLAMIFGIMKVINFAQGDFMMVGMYVVLFLFGSLGISSVFGSVVGPYIAILCAAPILYGFGWLVHRLLMRQVTGTRSSGMEGDGHFAQLILTLGLALVLENGMMILVGAGIVSIQTPLSSSAWVQALTPGGAMLLFLNKARAVAAIFSIVIIVALWGFIRRTLLGKTLRAAADNPEAAIYMGIDVDRAHRVGFALGTAVTAIAGGLLATTYPFQPFVGLDYIIIMYAGVVLGGFGSLLGAFWGGLLIGVVQQLSNIVLPTQLQNATIFIFFLLIMILRPQGLFGRNVERT